MPEPRLFHLQRDHDVSGVSGTGRVADGVLWPDGSVTIRWRGERPSSVHWDRLDDAEHVHGHQGATRIVWADAQPSLPEVWSVWRDEVDGEHGLFASLDDARQGSIDCWEEREERCPDYSWRPDGDSWELLVGDERSGVIIGRHKVYGQPKSAEAQQDGAQP